MAKVFENNSGLIIGPKTQTDKQIIVIQVPGGSTVFAEAPVTSIKISQQTDFSLAKTLAGNFNLVVFQDLPVVINLSGLRALKLPCGNIGTTSIGQLYKALKGNADKRIKIIIGDRETYEGVVASLQQRSTASEFPGLITYQLAIFGVRSK